MALKENSKKVLDYVMANENSNITATDISEALGLTVKQVNGIVTSAFQKKGFMERKEAEVELEDGSHKKVKFIRMTDLGKSTDFDAPETTEAE